MTAVYSKPTSIPRWADTSLNVTEPSSGKKDEGWLVGEKGISSWENWRAKLVGSWFKWLNERFSDGASKDALRVLCPKTGTQTLEVDDNIVRFFEIATPAEQVSIRKSTSKHELQWVLSEAADYPALSYNRSLLSLAMSFSRTAIGDDIDTNAAWRITSLGELFLRGTTPRFEIYESDTTGDGSIFRIPTAGGVQREWKFQLDNHSSTNPVTYFQIAPKRSGFSTPNIEFLQRVYLSGNSQNSVESLIIKVKTTFDSDDLPPMIFEASTNDPNAAVLTDGSIWRRDTGSSDQFRARIDGQTVEICNSLSYPSAKAWCLAKIISGTASLTGTDYNVASVSKENSGYNLRVHFTNPLEEDATVCAATMRSAENYVLQVLPEYPVTGGEITWVDIRAIHAASGSSVDFDSDDIQVFLIVFGQSHY